MADEQVTPQPADVVRPPATTAQAAPAAREPEESPADKAARLRREAAEIEASLPAPEGTARVRVEPPHDGLHFGGISVGNEFVPVNVYQLSGLQAAAESAGVKLTTE